MQLSCDRVLQLENVLVKLESDKALIKLCDFGSGTDMERCLSQDVGTAMYTDPAAVIQHQLDEFADDDTYSAEATDIFQCGVVLFVLTHIDVIISRKYWGAGSPLAPKLPQLWQGEPLDESKTHNEGHGLHPMVCPFIIGNERKKTFFEVCQADVNKVATTQTVRLSDVYIVAQDTGLGRPEIKLRSFWEFWGFACIRRVRVPSLSLCGCTDSTSKYRDLASRMLDVATPHDRIRIAEALEHP